MSTVLQPTRENPERTRDPFRPSDYTGLLMYAIRSRCANFNRGKGLDMGVGNGVLLAVLAQLGVQELYGIDIDPAAVEATNRLMHELELTDRAHILQGSLWEPVANEQFDVVVANLPHFAATEPSDPDHSRYWSMGGPDGRKWVDPFLAGLRPHLTDTGVAFITHNVFVGLTRTEEILASHGLTARAILGTSAVLHPLKSSLLHPQVRATCMGAGINRLGPYEFADVQILEIRPTGST
jgi:methylase of polypeptide subunit release factors